MGRLAMCFRIIRSYGKGHLVLSIPSMYVNAVVPFQTALRLKGLSLFWFRARDTKCKKYANNAHPQAGVRKSAPRRQVPLSQRWVDVWLLVRLFYVLLGKPLFVSVLGKVAC